MLMAGPLTGMLAILVGRESSRSNFDVIFGASRFTIYTPAFSLMRVLMKKMRISTATDSCRLVAEIRIADLPARLLTLGVTILRATVEATGGM